MLGSLPKRPRAFSIRNLFRFNPDNSSRRSKHRKLIKWGASGTPWTAQNVVCPPRADADSGCQPVSRQMRSLDIPRRVLTICLHEAAISPRFFRCQSRPPDNDSTRPSHVPAPSTVAVFYIQSGQLLFMIVLRRGKLIESQFRGPINPAGSASQAIDSSRAAVQSRACH